MNLRDDSVTLSRTRLERLSRAAIEAGVAVDDAVYCLDLAVHAPLRHEAVRPAQHLVAVYTLGRFALLVQGKPLVFHGKAPHKPIELLQALIALGGREVHASLLLAAVWPDNDSTDPRNLFDNTLHRLRHLLGSDEAVSLHDGKLSLDAHHCWVDAWAFERLAALAMSGPPAQAEPAADQAISLYEGAFLAREDPHPWSRALRHKLQARFSRLIAATAARLEEQGRWPEAKSCCERGLEIDPLDEPLYRHLMAGHARRGEASEVLRVYARCREHLKRGLGVEPAAQTDAIRQSMAAPLPRLHSDL